MTIPALYPQDASAKDWDLREYTDRNGQDQERITYFCGD